MLSGTVPYREPAKDNEEAENENETDPRAKKSSLVDPRGTAATAATT